MQQLLISCYEILSIPLNVEGFSFSLFSVMLFGIVGFLLLHFIFRGFR